MSLPAQSADLNFIELVCDELDWKLRVKQPMSMAHIRQLLWEIWAKISSVYNQSFVERKSRIREAVIAAKGSHFDESKF